jgi:hypothetical protein
MKYKCITARNDLFDKNKIYDVTVSYSDAPNNLYIYKIYCRSIKRWLEFTTKHGFCPSKRIEDVEEDINIFGNVFKKYNKKSDK